MHGIGNDFVLIDAIREPAPGRDLAALARRICDRKYGVGSDGLIVLEYGTAEAFRMVVLNPDGSESEMCGNGIRCLAKFLREHGHSAAERVPIETGAGVLTVEVQPDGWVRVDMGEARFERRHLEIAGEPDSTLVDEPFQVGNVMLKGTAVSMGNPHLVVVVDDLASVPLESWGSSLERSPVFPNRVNVHFVEVVDRTHLLQRTWERGAGATLACGTGACAAAAALSRLGLSERSVRVRLPGGELRIEWADSGRVFMSGPAETAFSGEWPA